jgi:hypothetical protein
MIIVIGDSWGMGEWGTDKNNNYCLTGPGIAQYLGFYKPVINLSFPGGDNENSLTNLENLFKQFTPTRDDEFFWIVTDPQRSVTIDQFLNTPTTLYNQLVDSLKKSFIRANKLSTDHNIIIKLIGGLCDIDPQWVDSYSNLKLVVPSWGKLIDENYSTYIGFSSGNRWADLGKEIKNQAPHLLKEWINLSDLIVLKANSMKKLQGFGFGLYDTHPSRYGHQILRNFLYPALENKN